MTTNSLEARNALGQLLDQAYGPDALCTAGIINRVYDGLWADDWQHPSALEIGDELDCCETGSVILDKAGVAYQALGLGMWQTPGMPMGSRRLLRRFGSMTLVYRAPAVAPEAPDVARLRDRLRNLENQLVPADDTEPLEMYRALLPSRLVERLKEASAHTPAYAGQENGWAISRHTFNRVAQEFINVHPDERPSAQPSVARTMVEQLMSVAGGGVPLKRSLFPDATADNDQFWVTETMFEAAEMDASID